MTVAEQLRNGIFGQIDGIGRRCADIDRPWHEFSEAPLHPGLKRRQRHEDAVVLVLPHAGLTLLLEHANDRERGIADAHDLPDRIDTRAEQFFRRALPDHRILRPPSLVGIGERRALRDRPTADHEILGERAVDGRAPGCTFSDHLGVDARLRRGRTHQRQLRLQRAQVLPGDRRLRAHATAHTTAGTGARHHEQHVGSRRLDHAADPRLGPLADRYHADYRRDTDDDAERSKERPQLVAPQGESRQTKRFTACDHDS